MTNKRRLIFGARAAQGALVGALCLAAPAAHAANCSSLSNVVYVAGSTAQEVFVGALAGALQQLPTPIHVVYQGQGSCIGVSYMSTAPTKLTSHGITFTNAGADDTVGCDLDTLGNNVDIGLSDVWATSCTGPSYTLATDVVDFHGPIQSMNFVVPTGTGGSDQVAISHDAAYLAFGLGAAGAAAPWTDPTVFEVRASSSGTMIMTGSVIGVPATQWWGNALGGGGAVVTALTTTDIASAKGENAIGILASSDAEKNRATLRQLAYQHTGQTKGYTPDSDSSLATGLGKDKQNVRDGHYMIWGPMHWLAHTDSKGVPLNASVKAMIDSLTGVGAPLAGLDLIQVEATHAVVPDCAMRVTRTTEGGDLSCYFPPEGSCTCAFLTDATGAKPDSCTTCTSDAQCKNVTTPDGHFDQGVCKNIIGGTGYCEVK